MMSLKWKLVSVRLEIVQILTLDWCTVCAELTIGSKIILDTRDETPSHVESHFDPFVHGVSVGAKLVRGLRQTYHRLRNRFGRTRWNS